MFESIYDALGPGTSKRTTIQYALEDGSEQELIKLDAVISETHGFQSETTDHEIEDGSNITDHVIKKGRPLSISGVVSDDPITIGLALLGNVSGAVGGLIGGVGGTLISGAISSVGKSAIYSGKPSKNAYDAFDQIYEKRIPITIITGLRTYNNCIITDLSIQRDARTSSSLTFTAQFKEVRVVSSESIIVPPANISSSARPGAVAKTALGKLNPSEAISSVQERGRSILSRITGIGG